MRIASVCAVLALALGFVHSHAMAEMPPPPRPDISQVEQARNTFIFSFDESVSRGEMHARAREIVGDAGGSLRHVYTNVVGGFAATIPATAVWNIAGRRDIIAFERDEIVTIAQGKGPIFGGGGNGGGGQTTPWGVKRIGAPIGKNGDAGRGAGIHVYVIDTGIDFYHDDLNVIINESWDCVKGCAKGAGHDDHGHGTHVAGTIGAMDNGWDVVGVAPEVTLYAIKVLRKNGSGFRSDVIAGIDKVTEAALAEGPVVANLSLGGSGSKTGTCTDGKWIGSDAYHKAFCNGAAAGVVFVVAAGNDGGDAENLVPAAYDDAVITVSATLNKDGNDDWPSWSSWGNNTAWGVELAPVAIAASGVSILSTKLDGGTTTKSGTSMASPHVAGIAAILLSDANVTYGENNYSTFTEVRAKILKDAASTEEWINNSGNPHAESLGCASPLC